MSTCGGLGDGGGGLGKGGGGDGEGGGGLGEGGGGEGGGGDGGRLGVLQTSLHAMIAFSTRSAVRAGVVVVEADRLSQTTPPHATQVGLLYVLGSLNSQGPS